MYYQGKKRQIACAITGKKTDSMCCHRKKTESMCYHGRKSYHVLPRKKRQRACAITEKRLTAYVIMEKSQLACAITEKKTDSMCSQGENISHRINNTTSHQDFD